MWRLLFFLLLYQSFTAQNIIKGRIQSEDNVPLNGVLVMNMASSERVVSDNEGNFSIPAKIGEELRFIRKGHERASVVVQVEHFQYFPLVKLKSIVQEIPQVEILALSGNLAKDSKLFNKENKVEKLRKQIGVPAPPEKPREKVYEVKDIFPSFGVGTMIAQIDIQAMYDVLSGENKKKKRLYEFEDMQDNIKWLRRELGEDYFKEMDIPENKISEFILFAITNDTKIANYVKAKNSGEIMLRLENVIPVFKERLQNKTK